MKPTLMVRRADPLKMAQYFILRKAVRKQYAICGIRIRPDRESFVLAHVGPSSIVDQRKLRWIIEHMTTTKAVKPGFEDRDEFEPWPMAQGKRFMSVETALTFAESRGWMQTKKIDV